MAYSIIAQRFGKEAECMNDYLCDTSADLASIAECTAGSTAYVVSEKKTYIRNCCDEWCEKPQSSGGSSGGAAVENKNYVNFYDYEGTLLHSYSKDEVEALTELPPLPSHDGLICQGWNWSLEDIKAEGKETDVGAMYITDDGKTRLYISIAAEGRMDVPLYFQQTVANGVTIDWGDGSATETLSGTGHKSTKHTYATVGDYVITLDVAEGCALNYGGNASSVCVMGGTGNNGKVYCNMLRKVEMGNRVTTIGDSAFNGCYALTSIAIPDGVTSIGTYAFSSCYSLASITIPEGVTSIGSSAFNGCFALASIIIPDGVTSIGTYAFSSCHSLASITIPDGVTTIGDSAFSGCYSLTSIIIPDGVTSIGKSAFSSCYSLASITIPDGVTSIGTYVFSNCYALASITIPDGVTSIGSSAFNNCYALASITIPDGVTSIGDSAFNNCYSLASIIIPDGVTSIGTYAFSSCHSLASIIIPDGVTTIGSNAFNSCHGMKFYDFTKHTAVPTLANTNAFRSIPSDCEIRVLAALCDEWIAATNWSTYASQIVAK